VLKLRFKIWEASRNGNFKQIRNIQKLLAFSTPNILYSIRKVTQINSGSSTPGFDNEIFDTPAKRFQLFLEIRDLKISNYQPLATKRIYIPKPDGRQRPLGIPTLKDRVIQQCIKNSLEPEWEAKFEPSSYGFRPARSVNDAMNRLFVSFNSPNSREWVVDADITGCFDNIDHKYLLEQLKYFPFRSTIEKWLKAGIIYDNVFFSSEDGGTPQGSIISPLLSNIALHGMEAELGVKIVNKEKHYVKTGSRSFIRYADDFVVLCYSKEDAQLVITQLVDILGKRGLSLSEAKTSIKHITDGFDFLGFNVKRWPFDNFNRDQVFIQYENKYIINYNKSYLLIKPSEKSIEKFKSTIKGIFDKYKGDKAALMVNEANSVIRGWAQSKMYWHCNRIFHTLDNYIFNLQVRWIKRMHPNKSWNWVKNKYFYNKIEGYINNKWVFHAQLIDKKGNSINIDMLQLKWFPHTDWTMLAHSRNPLNKQDTEYFEGLEANRQKKKPISVLNKFDKKLVTDQDNKCPVCGESLWNGEKLHKHHITAVKDGGSNSPSNLVILHLLCHQKVHYGGDTEQWKQHFYYIKKHRA